MKNYLIAGCAAVAMIVGASAEHARAQSAIEVGMLSCTVAGGVGFIFGSSKDMSCRFEHPGGVERYSGTISKFGIDIGITGKAYMRWAVLAPRTNLQPGALEGNYGGATAEATAGLGIGANALVGGGNSITLQPLSVQGQTGLNVAAGIASMKLRYR